MSLGKGAIISNYNNQNLNVNSSTEGELVATHDHIPDILHTLYFIEAQGNKISKHIIYKDNQSTVGLDVNGRISSGKKTNHLSSSFFFITENIAKGEVYVNYCPTEKMWCDLLNKPNQRAPYRLDCSHLMNVPLYYDDKIDHKATHPHYRTPRISTRSWFHPKIGIYPRPIQIRCTGVCWVVALRKSGGNQHKSYQKICLGNTRENVSYKRST